MNVIGVLALLIVIILGIVFTIFWRTRLVGILFLVSAVGFMSFQWSKESIWSNKFETIPNEASLEIVISMLGEPSVLAESSKPPFGYSLADSDNRIAKEAWYVSFFFPEQYTFGFDTDGKLVRKYHYTSP